MACFLAAREPGAKPACEVEAGNFCAALTQVNQTRRDGSHGAAHAVLVERV